MNIENDNDNEIPEKFHEDGFIFIFNWIVYGIVFLVIIMGIIRLSQMLVGW